jgi:23S rRNA A2030 N6-methylase RlmJ
VTVIGVVPDAMRFMQPGIRFPAIVKVTRPATETRAVVVIDTPFETIAGIVRITEIAAEELFVIIRVEIAAISLPA